MITNTKMISFQDHRGKLGNLVAIEENRDVPFSIKRIYYITEVPEHMTRGFHSHRKLEQVLLCLNGEVKIRVKTPTEEDVIMLNNSSEGLFIGHMVWREMFDFTAGTVLLVLASEYYSEDDYIRSYDQYSAEAKIYFKE